MFDLKAPGLVFADVRALANLPPDTLLCDPITGLIAYPCIERYLVAHIQALIPKGLHLAIGDVDDLRGYVTTYNAANPAAFGHLAGFDCMRRVGEITSEWAVERLQPAELSLCATFGGDEVVLAVAGMEFDAFTAEVRELAARLRERAPRACSFAIATLSQAISPSLSARDIFIRFVAEVDRSLFDYKAARTPSSPPGAVIEVGVVRPTPRSAMPEVRE